MTAVTDCDARCGAIYTLRELSKMLIKAFNDYADYIKKSLSVKLSKFMANKTGNGIKYFSY